MIDTQLIRANLQAGHMRNTNIDGSTHYDGCENNHLPCAIFALCDELDEARAIVAKMHDNALENLNVMTEAEKTAGKIFEDAKIIHNAYSQARAEVERMRERLRQYDTYTRTIDR